MGKHERGLVESAEIIVASLLNGDKLSSTQKKHPFLNLINDFVKLIKSEYKNIKSAEAIGNEYNSPGDILLTFNNGERKFLELKFLEKSGYGTLANISQDALTLLGVYDCESWSSFRKRTGHSVKVKKILNKFKYPFGSIKKDDPNSKIYEAAGYLKQVIKAGDRNVEGVCKEYLGSPKGLLKEKLASKIILEIIKMDKASRKKYLSILKKSKINKERLKKLVFLLLNGSHTQKILDTKIKQPLTFDGKNKDYSIYYLYKETGSIVKEYGARELYEIPNNFFDIEIKNDETNLIVFLIDKKKRINLIRVVFHWKNKFGGIQTPCLNVFKF